jgi:PAS domain-containing protein
MAMGFCLPCLSGLERHDGSELLAQVEELTYPAVVVDSETRIRAANRPACQLFQAPWVALLGQRFSTILSCDHPHTLEHWQDAQVAPGCEVHYLLTRTLQTGVGGTVTLPSLEVMDLHPLPRAAHRITTLSIGDLALVRIEPLRHPFQGILTHVVAYNLAKLARTLIRSMANMTFSGAPRTRKKNTSPG